MTTTELIILFLFAIMGMFTHFLKKKIKGETLLEIKSYFKTHLKSTVTAFIITVIGYWFTAFYLEETNPLTYFLLGYMFDSMLNKWEGDKDKYIKTRF